MKKATPREHLSLVGLTRGNEGISLGGLQTPSYSLYLDFANSGAPGCSPAQPDSGQRRPAAVPCHFWFVKSLCPSRQALMGSACSVYGRWMYGSVPVPAAPSTGLGTELVFKKVSVQTKYEYEYGQ